MTALVVAAPLAVRAIRADGPSSYATYQPAVSGDPATGSRSQDDLSSDFRERTLSGENTPAQGGIGARARTKAQGQTNKSTEPGTTQAPASATSLLTNDTAAVTSPPETTATTAATAATTSPATEPSVSSVPASPTSPTSSTIAPATSSTAGSGSTTVTTTPSSASTSSSVSTNSTSKTSTSTTSSEATTATEAEPN